MSDSVRRMQPLASRDTKPVSVMRVNVASSPLRRQPQPNARGVKRREREGPAYRVWPGI